MQGSIRALGRTKALISLALEYYYLVLEGTIHKQRLPPLWLKPKGESGCKQCMQSSKEGGESAEAGQPESNRHQGAHRRRWLSFTALQTLHIFSILGLIADDLELSVFC